MGILRVATVQKNKQSISIDKAFILGIGTLVPAAMLHNEPELGIILDVPAEAVTRTKLFISINLAAVEFHRRVHEFLLFTGKHFTFLL